MKSMWRPERLIIDGNNFALVSNFAMALSTRKGEPTQGVYGFLARLVSLAVRYEDAKFFVVWDKGKESFRKTLFPEYKRRKFSEEMKRRYKQFFVQLPDIKVLAENLISTVTCEVCCENGKVYSLTEADDKISFFVRMSESKDLIVSTDKDFFQLVDSNTAILRQDVVLTLRNFCEKLGYKSPARFFESRLLVGDSSDSIPGVPGVGEKTAKSLLSRGTLSEVLAGGVELKNFREKKVIERESVQIIKRNYLMMRLPPIRVGREGSRVESVNLVLKSPRFERDKIEQILTKNEIVSFSASDLIELFAGRL